MKFFISFILLLSSQSLFAQGNCSYLFIGIQAVTSLVQDVAKVQTSRFDPKFCQAFKDCGSFQSEKKKAEFIKQNNSKFLTLESRLAEAEKNLSVAKTEYEKLMKGTNEDALKALPYSHWISSLQNYISDTQKLNQTFKDFLKDPKSSLESVDTYDAFKDVPTLEVSQSRVKSAMAMLDSTPYIKTNNLYLDSYKKKIEDAQAATPPNLKIVKDYENSISYILKENKELEAKQKSLKDYLANPKTVPFPAPLLPKPYKSLTEKKDPCREAEMYYQEALSSANDHKSGHCGMTPSEMAAISFYTNSGYGCMNSYLRTKDEPFRNLDLLTQSLNSGLGKLPSYKGLVRRGGNLPDSLKSQHAKGSIVDYKAYTSTSTSDGFADSDDLFMIYSKNGKPIMSFSVHDDEFEVLFKEGTKFKILDVQPKGDKTFYIMKEVGTGSPSEEAKADAQLLSSIKSLPTKEYEGDGNKNKNPDKWSCPLDEKASIPKMIQQKKAPRF